MIKRLMLLNGLSILGVVWAHAVQWVWIVMFWWTDRYRAVAVPNYDQIGTLSYYTVVFIQKLASFAVPTFLFASGFFVAYASRGQAGLKWKTVITRLKNLLIPYVIWSAVIFIGDFLKGDVYAPLEYVRRLLWGEAVPAYYYIILLVQLYLLAPLIVPIAKRKGWQVLLASGLLLLGVIGLFYLKFYAEWAGIEMPLVDRLINLIPSQLFVRFIFFFVGGIVAGFHLQPFRQWLARFRWQLLAATIVLVPLAALETELVFRLTDQDWRGGIFTITGSLYAICFILCFLAFDKASLPVSKVVYELGRTSFGIYLVHTTLLEFFARALQKYTPWLLPYPVAFLLGLTTLTVGAAWLFMVVVAKLPVRWLYRYLFG